MMPTRTRALRRRAAALLIAAVAVPGWLAEPAGAIVSDDADRTWMTNGRVNAVLVHGDRVYIGGSFTALRSPDGRQSVARNNIAAIDPTTGVVDPAFNPGANNEVSALATDGRGSSPAASSRASAAGPTTASPPSTR